MEEDIKIIEELRRELGLYAEGEKIKVGMAIEHLLKEYKKLVTKTKKQNERSKRQQEENKKLNKKILNQKGQLKALNIAYKENNHLRNADLTSVYLKGVYDGKEQATIDNSICKEKMAEDALQENVKLKRELADSTPNSVIRE